jgi:hypothetical protein
VKTNLAVEQQIYMYEDTDLYSEFLTFVNLLMYKNTKTVVGRNYFFFLFHYYVNSSNNKGRPVGSNEKLLIF